MESLGLTPLAAEIAHIDAIATPRDVARYIGYSQRIGHRAAVRVVLDVPTTRTRRCTWARCSRTASRCRTATTTCPPTTKYAQFRAKFAVYVEQMLARAGERNARSAAARIAALETRIANYQWTKVQNRDPVKTYNPMSLPEYQKLAPGLRLAGVLRGHGRARAAARHQPALVHQGHGAAGEDRAGIGLARVLQIPAARRLRARAVAQFADLEFDFHQRTLNGVPEPRPRWRRAVDAMDGNMGELVGRMFVEAHFGAEAKQRMLELVGNLLKAFDTSIDGLEWMRPDTRAEAKKKLAKITVKIGYPDKWRDYSTLTIKRDDLVGNLLRASEFQHQRFVSARGRTGRQGRVADDAADRQRVLQPATNEITFPAAILRLAVLRHGSG